jgi:hypothetical protein
LGDAPKARTVVEATASLEVTWVVEARRSFEAAIAAIEGRGRDASASYDAVLAARLAAGDPFGHALMVVDASSVLPAELMPEGSVETARAYLEGLGAMPLLKRLSAVGAIR